MTKKIKVKKPQVEPEEAQQSAEEKLAEQAREEAGIQDEFQAKGFELVEWMQDHSQVVLALIGVVVLAGAVLGGSALMQEGRDEAASAAYARALEAFEAPLGDASEGDDAAALRFVDAKARATEARMRFQTVVREHDDSDVASLAQLYVARTSVQLGEFAAAVDAYEAFLRQASDNDPMRGIAVDGLAAALESKGDVDAAIARTEAWASSPKAVAIENARLRLGRLYAAKGDTAKAKEQLERLKSDFPDSTLTSSADELLARLK